MFSLLISHYQKFRGKNLTSLLAIGSQRSLRAKIKGLLNILSF